MHPPVDTLVIGAGQAGLAAGYQLQRAGRSFTILDAGAQPGGSWPQYYGSLRLFSPARFSSLPGLRFPGDPERYPARDEVITYLRDYATHFQLPIVGGTRVARITREQELFAVQADTGQVFQARSLIAAPARFTARTCRPSPTRRRFAARSCTPMPTRTQPRFTASASSSSVAATPRCRSLWSWRRLPR
jgi:putative flavoprotein involved in K+ transport